MAATGYSLYSIDGVTEYKFDRTWPNLYLPPWFPTWTQTPIDNAGDGSQIYGLYKSVIWDFAGYRRGIKLAQFDLFRTLRQADGSIRFSTRNTITRQWVECFGRVDLAITGGAQGGGGGATIDERRGTIVGLRVAFDRVVEV